MFNFGEYHRKDGTIDLVKATIGYLQLIGESELLPNALAFLKTVEDIHHIRSRQAAAIAIAMAARL